MPVTEYILQLNNPISSSNLKKIKFNKKKLWKSVRLIQVSTNFDYENGCFILKIKIFFYGTVFAAI